MLRRIVQTGKFTAERGFELWSRRVDGITRDWMVVTAGSAGRLGLGFVASIVIARALGPEAFGVYAVLAAIGAFAGAGIDLGLTNAAVRRVSAAWPADLDGVRDVWRAFFWLRTLIAVVFVGIALLLARPVSSLFLDVPDRTLYFALAVTGVAATAMSGSVTGMLQATSRFARLSAVLLVNSGLTVLLALGLALVGHLTITTALLVLGIGTTIISFGLAYRLLPGKWSLRTPDRATFTRHSGDLINYGSWLWIGSLFGILALYIDVLLVNHWAAPAIVGVYALAVNLSVKIEVVNQSLYTVLLPAASSLKTREQIVSYIRSGLVRSALIGVALLPLFVLARPVITIFYGESYAPAAGIFQGLLLVAILNVVLTPLLMLAFTYDRPRVVALTEGIRTAVLLLVGIALVPALGTDGAIIAKLAAALGGGVVIVVFVVQQLRSPVEPTVQGE